MRKKVRVNKEKEGKRRVKIKKMGKRDMKAYKKLLLDERERITGEIQHITKDNLKKSQKDASGDISGYTYHMADVATDSYDREFSLGIASNEVDVLYDINEALKRIEEGIYGTCLACEKAITKKRLKAVPHTKCCISCQSKEEKRNKQT